MPTFKPKPPATIRQALALADKTLTAASHLRLDTLFANGFTTEADRLRLLTDLGGIHVAYTELDWFVPAFAELGRKCRKAKPTANTHKEVLELLTMEAAPLSATTTEALARLPELAAAVAQERAKTEAVPDESFPRRERELHPRLLTGPEQEQYAAAARAEAVEAATIIAQLPALLGRVRALVEAGEDLKPAAAWLK